MSKEANLAILGKFAEAVGTGNYDLFKEVVSTENVDHDPGPGQVQGPEGYRMLFSGLRAAFPDMNVALETMVADDDSIAFAYTLTGTQNGPFMGVAPTGKKIKIRGMRVELGEIESALYRHPQVREAAVIAQRDDIEGIDSSIILNRLVWKYSGHEATFHDPLTDCRECKARHRADKLRV